MRPFLSLLIPVFCLSGCSSLGNHMMCWISPGGDSIEVSGIPFGQSGKPDSDERYAPGRPKARMPFVYSGTIGNVKFISKAVTCSPSGTQFTCLGLPCQREWTTDERVNMGICSFIDLPISLVMDTALLPVDIVMASCCSESERAIKEEEASQRYWADAKKYKKDQEKQKQNETITMFAGFPQEIQL